MGKANLIKAKNTLAISTQGYEILDKKIYILLREVSDIKFKIDKNKKSIEEVLALAKTSLKKAGLEVGLNKIHAYGAGVNLCHVEILQSSIMGIEIPLVKEEAREDIPFSPEMPEDLYHAISHFKNLKELILLLVMLESSAQKVNEGIRKTEIRANALKKVIARQKRYIILMESKIEEDEREEFVRLKVGKIT